MSDQSPPWAHADVVSALELTTDPDATRGFRRISTDTRRLSPGDLFVALEGVRFDGHAFLDHAASAGATGAVVHRVPEDAPQSLEYFVVKDTLQALGGLARHRRLQLGARVVGIVGSNGKTTTRELIRAALGGRYRTHANESNQNNRIGVPLTILAAPAGTQVLVLELGTSEPGEIALLTDIVQPDAAVVTSIGEEHLEKLQTVDDVLAEETEILRGLRDGGVAFVAEDPPSLPERARGLLGRDNVCIAGFSSTADVRPDAPSRNLDFDSDGRALWHWQGIPVRLSLPGAWNVRNALLALGLAESWGIPAEEAVARIERVTPPALRAEWKTIAPLRVLADCYNANPPSMRAAIELMAALPSKGAKVVVLGTMAELGTASDALHASLAAVVAGHVGRDLDLVVATGAFASAFQPLASELGERLILCADPITAYHIAESRLADATTMLLKASRSEALERWLPLLETSFARRS